MKLERHVGGLSLARKANYLRARGWREEAGGWSSGIFGQHPLAKAVHHQLTDDLSQALRERGWQVLGFSERGYVRMREGERGKPCSLPKALRTQARREKRPVAELTYALFLAALLETGDSEGEGA
jgi:hypothetical protein